ncbi:MAG: hypothetical protein JRJ12_17015 [Deltaproteobacteria bacterium]|nr:hypothetical protein [Deltaproteobacteria bacterium]MBW2072899.1 hypothetical protein [Deltaproteobacteria bacterium]
MPVLSDDEIPVEDHEDLLEQDLDPAADLELLEQEAERQTINVAGLSEEQLRAKLARIDADTGLAYSLDGKFAVGDIIRHAVFGPGIVARQLSPKKIEVVFQDSKKVLVMNYRPAVDRHTATI